MAKKSQRRPLRYERGQAGCMWGLISMFDFRHTRLNQKLLSDKKRVPSSSAGLPENKLDLLTGVNEHSGGIVDAEERKVPASGSHKPSVKKLIEEEMFCEQGLKNEIDEGQCKHSNSGPVDIRWKNSKRTNRGRSKSFDMHSEDLKLNANFRSHGPRLKNLQRRSTKSLDFDEIMEEFCHQTQPEKIDCVCDQPGADGVHAQPNLQNHDFDEKLGQAIRLFISQRLIDRNHIKEDRDHWHSEELRDALQILRSDEELVLKHLQDPKSIMVKSIENIWNAEIEKDNNLIPCPESESLQQQQEGTSNKKSKFFRKKTKSSVKNMPSPDLVSQTSNGIVILKPGLTGSLHPRAEGSFYSSPEFVIRNKGTKERLASYFFLTELRKKLKNAVGKERQEVSIDRTSKKLPKGQKLVRDGERGPKDSIGGMSPSKEHFFAERIARPSKSAIKVEKTKLLQEGEAVMEHETGKNRNERLTNLYIEAKKHLSEVLSSEVEDVDSPKEHISKTLGRILSLAENNISPAGTPGRVSEQVAEKLTANDEPWEQASGMAENQTCTYDDKIDDEVEVPVNLKSSGHSVLNDDLENACSCGGDEIKYQDGREIEQVTEILVCGENIASDTEMEPYSSSVIMVDQNSNSSEASSESLNPDSLESFSEKVTKTLSTPTTSPSVKRVEQLQDTSQISEKPSPTSVLEPLFFDDDISPASIKSQPGALHMQPLRIHFEDVEYTEHSTAKQDTLFDTCEEDKESMFEYVRDLLQASGMDWDDFYIRSFSSDQLLDPSVLDEAEFFSDLPYCDKKLLFDSVNEVLMEIFMQHLGSFTGLSIIKPCARPIPDTKSTISEVWNGVQWHLRPIPQPHTLDQIVKKDMSRSGMWMDLQEDAQTVVVELGDAIFDDLIEETTFVLELLDRSSGNQSTSIQTALEECETI